MEGFICHKQHQIRKRLLSIRTGRNLTFSKSPMNIGWSSTRNTVPLHWRYICTLPKMRMAMRLLCPQKRRGKRRELQRARLKNM